MTFPTCVTDHAREWNRKCKPVAGCQSCGNSCSCSAASLRAVGEGMSSAAESAVNRFFGRFIFRRLDVEPRTRSTQIESRVRPGIVCSLGRRRCIPAHSISCLRGRLDRHKVWGPAQCRSLTSRKEVHVNGYNKDNGVTFCLFASQACCDDVGRSCKSSACHGISCTMKAAGWSLSSCLHNSEVLGELPGRRCSQSASILED